MNSFARMFGLQKSRWRRVVVATCIMLVGLLGRVAAEEVAPEPPTWAPRDKRSAASLAATAPAQSAVMPATYAVGIIAGSWTGQGPGPTTNAQVQNLSPNNEVSGAIHAVVAHPTDPDILYIGAVNGGVWRTVDATMASPTWTPLTDFEQSLSIGALEMDPGNPMILLAGIGRFSSFGGDPPFQLAGGDLSGLLRTTDGGNTWTAITDPLLVGEHISSVASRGNILLAGANNFFGGGTIGGLFRSADTGATWSQITGAGAGLPGGSVDDLVGDPSSATRLYVALEGNGIYRTDDTGANWTPVSANDATLNGAMLGSSNTRIAAAGDARVFALVTSGANVSYIGFSDDLGTNWTQMDVPGTVETPLQGRDELMGMVVDPSDSDIVYVSAITQRGAAPPNPFPNSVGATSFHAHMFRGDVTRARGIVNNVSSQWDHLTHQAGAGGMPNGGTANTSSPHADSREMTFDANGNLIEVDDGGINRRTNPGNNTGGWFSINGDIQVAELHSVAYDSNFDVIIGGTQDTGAIEQTGTGSTTWDSVRDGDGGDVAVDDSMAGTSVRYFSNQRLGNFTRRTCSPACVDAFPALAGGVPALVTGTGGNAQFYSPIELNTADSTRLIIGALTNVYESTNRGDTVSTVPAAGGVNVGANSNAAMVYGHPNNAELIYVGAGTQVFVRTTAGGNLTPTTAAFPGGTVFGVAVDPANENIVYAIGNASVFQTVDGGTNWTDITGNITADGAGSFRGIEYIPAATGDRLAVGANAGVLVSVEGSFGTWFQLGTGLPNAPVWDLDYDAADDALVAGTLGRGAWILANVSTLNVPPVAQCVDITVPTDVGVCFAASASVNNGSFDPDGGNITVEQIPPGPYALGITEVTLVVTDDKGAMDSCQAKITVEDLEAPVITCPADITVELENRNGAAVSFAATATDNCPSPIVQCVPPSGSVFPIGSSTVACTATDNAGNSDACQFTLIVLGPKGVKERVLADLMALLGGTPPSCECKGKVSELTLLHVGSNPIGLVQVIQHNGDIVFNGPVNPGETFTFVGSDKGTLGTEITILVDGVEHAKIHTSCSQPIGPGLQRGDFEIVSGSSAEGGPLCLMLSNKEDVKRLDKAIEYLQKSLEAKRWLDDLHLDLKYGAKVFEYEAKVVDELSKLIKSNKSDIANDVLQGLINRLVKADRVLAEVGIEEAIKAGVKEKDIEHAQKELAKAEKNLSEGKFTDALKYFGKAWKQATHGKIISIKKKHGGEVTLEFVGLPGITYEIQASANLVDWVTLGTVVADENGLIEFVDENAKPLRSRFYRIMTVP